MSSVVKEYVEWKIQHIFTDDDGLPHCTIGPALTFTNGRKDWYIHGKRHRDDGPAIVFGDGDEEWHRRGKLHRDDGPAFISREIKAWYKDGNRHHVSGPAVERDGIGVAWFVDGRMFTEEEFIRFVDPVSGELFIPPGRALRHDHKCELEPDFT